MNHNIFRAIQLKVFLKLYIKSGIRPSSKVTLKDMLDEISSFTQASYRTQDKLKALEDITHWLKVVETLRKENV